MEKYAPNMMELASRDVVSRAEQTEINEGRGVDGCVCSTSRGAAQAHPRGAARDRESASTSPASTSRRSRSRSCPACTTSWAASRPTWTARPRSPASTPRARRPASASTAPTASARTRCSTRSSSASARASTRRIAPGPWPIPGRPLPARGRGPQDPRALGRERTGHRVSEIKADLGSTMDKYAAVFRDEDGLTQGLEIVRRLKEEALTVAIDDKGKVFNPDLFALELGYMLDCAEMRDRRRDRAQGEPRRPLPHRLSGAQRRRVAEAHRSAPTPRTDRRSRYSPVTITHWQPEERTY